MLASSAAKGTPFPIKKMLFRRNEIEMVGSCNQNKINRSFHTASHGEIMSMSRGVVVSSSSF
jgi:hypothetical protein